MCWWYPRRNNWLFNVFFRCWRFNYYLCNKKLFDAKSIINHLKRYIDRKSNVCVWEWNQSQKSFQYLFVKIRFIFNIYPIQHIVIKGQMLFKSYTNDKYNFIRAAKFCNSLKILEFDDYIPSLSLLHISFPYNHLWFQKIKSIVNAVSMNSNCLKEIIFHSYLSPEKINDTISKYINYES